MDLNDILVLVQSALDLFNDTSFVESSQLRDALTARLEFRRDLLRVVSTDVKDPSDSRSTLWRSVLLILPKISQSADHSYDASEAFSTKIQRRMASSVPPRPIVSIAFREAFVFLQRLCEDGLEAEKVFQCAAPSSIIIFVQVFQARKPQPAVFVRCQLQSLVFAKTGLPDKAAVKELLYQDLAELILPVRPLLDPENAKVEVPHDDRFQIAQKMDTFAADVRETYYDLLRTLNMNRCRMRRMLCHTVLDWDTLQLDLEDLDAELRRHTHEQPLRDQDGDEPLYAFPLSSWAYNLKLRQMAWIVQLGAELGVYQAGELAGAYWYLRYVADVRFKHLQRILGFLDVNAPVAALRHSAAVVRFNILEATATACLAEALSLVYEVCAHLSLLPAMPDDAYSSDELRHQLRMRPFLQLCHPPVPSHKDFPSTEPPAKEWSRLKFSVLRKLERVDSAVRAARAGWDKVLKAESKVAQCVGCEDAWRAGIKDVLKSSIAVGIASTGLKKCILDKGERYRAHIRVEIEGGVYSLSWIVPKVIML